MKFKLLFLLIILSMQANFAIAGDVGNGGGVSENNILQSRLDLVKYYKQMLNTRELNLSRAQRDQLTAIAARMPRENQTKLIFKKEADYPFAGKRYVTQPAIGSDIIFNLDQLYTLKRQQKIPFTLGETTALLTGILKRGDTILSDSEMEDLKNKIMALFAQTVTTFDLSSLKREEIQVSVVAWPSSAEVMLMDSIGITNITAIVTKALLCNESRKELKRFYNVHMGPRLAADASAKVQKISYKAWIDYRCGPESLQGEVTMTIPYLLKGKKRSSVQVNDNWWANEKIDAQAMVKNMTFNFQDIH